jgi:soluble cytochrome b562
MSLTDEQKHQLNHLIEYRDQIVDFLFHIETTLKKFFPEEFDIAYQHWIPQIMTGLYDDDKWLPRGEQSMQKTINRLLDKANEKNDQNIKKFI